MSICSLDSLVFFIEKNESKSFSHFFNIKNWRILDINIRNFNEMLTNDDHNFE